MWTAGFTGPPCNLAHVILRPLAVLRTKLFRCRCSLLDYVHAPRLAWTLVVSRLPSLSLRKKQVILVDTSCHQPRQKRNLLIRFTADLLHVWAVAALYLQPLHHCGINFLISCHHVKSGMNLFLEEPMQATSII
jgi:hypothetical protein